jgi:DNA-binding GntR family transcriptional regulator
MKNITPIERPKSLKGLAYEKIKKLLLTGQLEFGKIYSANQFAEILGVSRTPIREALIQLTTEGYLIPTLGRGFKIREFSEKEIKDFFETRKMIEVYVIKRLVNLLNDFDFEYLEQCCNRMNDNLGPDYTSAFLEADKDFHMSLIHRYNNLFLESIMADIRNLISIFGQKALSYPGRTKEVIEEHIRVLQFLRQRNGDKAVDAMISHLDTTEKYLLENIREK